jgi:hypothetical protein
MRDDFTQSVKETLAKRVGYKCSNPSCRCLTSGPQVDPNKAINVGVASHITAASPEGPRYDNTMSSDARASIENGIWLCQKCAKLVDNDIERYPSDTLHIWKDQAEKEALFEVEGMRIQSINHQVSKYRYLEQHMSALLDEMRGDLKKYPLKREFVLLKREWFYCSNDGSELVYYYNEHPDLDDKIRVLENNHLLMNITNTNVKRYLFTEAFVACLTEETIS